MRQIFFKLFLLTAVSALLLLPAAVSADETIGVSPSLVLNFSGVPDGVFDGAEITLTASSGISSDVILSLMGLDDFNVINAAYAVNVSIKNLNLSQVSGCSLYIPVSKEWNPENKPVRAAVFYSGSESLESVSLVKGDEKNPDTYCVNLSKVPEVVVLVFGTDGTEVPSTVTPSATASKTVPPTPTSSPVGFSAVLFGAAAALIFLRNKQ